MNETTKDKSTSPKNYSLFRINDDDDDDDADDENDIWTNVADLLSSNRATCRLKQIRK